MTRRHDKKVKPPSSKWNKSACHVISVDYLCPRQCRTVQGWEEGMHLLQWSAPSWEAAPVKDVSRQGPAGTSSQWAVVGERSWSVRMQRGEEGRSSWCRATARTRGNKARGVAQPNRERIFINISRFLPIFWPDTQWTGESSVVALSWCSGWEGRQSAPWRGGWSSRRAGSRTPPSRPGRGTGRPTPAVGWSSSGWE